MIPATGSGNNQPPVEFSWIGTWEQQWSAAFRGVRIVIVDENTPLSLYTWMFEWNFIRHYDWEIKNNNVLVLSYGEVTIHLTFVFQQYYHYYFSLLINNATITPYNEQTLSIHYFQTPAYLIRQ